MRQIKNIPIKALVFGKPTKIGEVSLDTNGGGSVSIESNYADLLVTFAESGMEFSLMFQPAQPARPSGFFEGLNPAGPDRFA